MGEVDTVLHDTLEKQGHQSRLPFTPKESSTTKHDMTVARFFYQHCQKIDVPLTIVNDEVTRLLAWSVICLYQNKLIFLSRPGGNFGCNSKLTLRRTGRRGRVAYWFADL
jgi:hypothetical protein